MEKRQFKQGVYSGIAQMTKALSNAHRLEMLDLLAQGEKTVEAIAAEISVSVANASQHLQVLKQARLVTIRKQGHYIYYDLANAEVFNTWYALRSLSIRQMPQVKEVIRDFRHQRDSLEAMTLEELYQRLNSDEVVLLDVRPAEEYQRGHIPSAISMPLEQWDSLLATLPRHKQIIVYCRGPFCVYSDEAVGDLKSKGYQAVRLAEGFPDWKKRGLPVAC